VTDCVRRSKDDYEQIVSDLWRNGVVIVTDVHDTPWGTRELAIRDDQGHTIYIGAPGKAGG
jgi:uncharacterized glyoxalase superfamily protein PhnB